MTHDHSAGAAQRDGGSFRDPSGHVFIDDGRVIRTLDARSLSAWKSLASAEFFVDLMAAGEVVATKEIPLEEAGLGTSDWAGALLHETIPFVSYPYEWPFSMLKRAALLTLDIIAAALREDFILKDATPYNVQWRGSTPCFIDVGSFEQLEAGDVWAGYRQFCRLFLYPLMLQAYKEIPYGPWLRGRLDGISSAEFANTLGARDLLRRGTLLHGVLQARAERRYQATDHSIRTDMKAAGFQKRMIENNIAGLRKTVAALDSPADDSTWVDYKDETHVGSQRETKAQFLTQHAGTPGLAWDLGANDGFFSRLLADRGGYVVATDADEVVTDHLFRSLVDEGRHDILPLVVDLADPSPATGWRHLERTPLEHRGTPDLVVMYAIIHHMVVSGNIPVGEVVAWLAELNSRVVIEFVPAEDPMTQRLLANKRTTDVHGDYTEAAFRHHVERLFEIEAEAPVTDSRRRLFALRPRD